MKKKLYSPPKDIFGARRLLAGAISMTDKRQKYGKAAFKLFIASAPLARKSIIKSLYKASIKMGGKRPTQGYSLPLNIDLNESGKSGQIILPKDIMKKAVSEATYIALFKKCVCREIGDCQNYPKDLACIFLGKAAKVLVENGLAYEATPEECYERIEKAAELGLSGQAYWIEAEQPIWGFKPKEMDQFLELCFCCPCCCTAFKFGRKADDEIKTLFHRSTGWAAKVDAKACVGCMACYNICPRDSVQVVGGKADIDRSCGGCGLCVDKCQTKAISMVKVAETHKDLLDYFDGIKLKI